MGRVKIVARIFFAMAAQYALVVGNTRAIARGSYPFTIGTDAIIAANGLFLTKAAVSVNGYVDGFAYILGGCAGSATALWLTNRW